MRIFVWRLIAGVIFLSILRGDFCSYGNELLSLGRECADMHAILQGTAPCDEAFGVFIDGVVEKQGSLSVQDWETVGILTQQYVQKCVRGGDREHAMGVLQRLLALVRLPKKVRKECLQSWQRLNPKNLMLKDLLEQLYNTEKIENPQDHLLLQVYNMTLHSSYEDQKQAILFAKEQGRFSEALSLCYRLSQSLDQGQCSIHPDLVEIERCFLDKIVLILQIEKGLSEQGAYEHWLTAYFDAEEAYAEAIEALIMRIAHQEISRSQEVDSVLLAHALGKLTWDEPTAMKEIEVLIDRGNYLCSPISQYAYFSLLEMYYQQGNMHAIDQLLQAASGVFGDQHAYSPEYMFFLGCSLYHQRRYREAREAFIFVCNHASRLGITLARTYEYLGCIACMYGDDLGAKNFFLQAYKGWGQSDAQLGLFLVAAKLRDISLCQELMNHSSFSFFHMDVLRKIETLFLKDGGEGMIPTASHIYGNMVKSMIHEEEMKDVFRPVLGVLYSEIRNKEIAWLKRTLQTYASPMHASMQTSSRNALQTWFAYITEGRVGLQRLYQQNGDPLLLCCYDALRGGDAHAVDMLPQFFSSSCSYVQSVLRLAWLHVRRGRKVPEVFFDRLDSRVDGDRLYFFVYDFEAYVSRQSDAWEHLVAFPELFPNSSLLPMVYYVLGVGDASLVRRVHWLKKALEEFAMIPVGSTHAKSWAYMYYQLQLSLAEAYVSLGEYEHAAVLFEGVKEDWGVRNHPRVSLIQDQRALRLMEKRWMLGLADVYMQLRDQERFFHHLVGYLHHRWSCPHYLQEDVNTQLLPELKAMCLRVVRS